jgi:hypothetical protein
MTPSDLRRHYFDDIPADAISAVIMLARMARIMDEVEPPVERLSEYLDDPALALEDFKEMEFPL